jgi:hypothetical protein
MIPREMVNLQNVSLPKHQPKHNMTNRLWLVFLPKWLFGKLTISPNIGVWVLTGIVCELVLRGGHSSGRALVAEVNSALPDVSRPVAARRQDELLARVKSNRVHRPGVTGVLQQRPGISTSQQQLSRRRLWPLRAKKLECLSLSGSWGREY